MGGSDDEKDEKSPLLLPQNYHSQGRLNKCDIGKWLLFIVFVLFLVFDRGIWGGSGNKSKKGASESPHIIFFLVDDQGYNDIGYQSTDLGKLTPYIDNLADNGIKLRWYYGNHVCTPARAALMTGMYNIHLGMQHKIVTGNYLFGLPLDVSVMPQVMKKVGYNTIMFGKWHLGHYTKEHLPTRRGFENFLGFYSGFQDHFTHVSESTICDDDCYFDLRSGNATVDTSDLPDAAAYGPNLWRNAATSFIGQYEESSPLFMYYAESLVHEPCEAPEYIFTEYADLLDDIPNSGRRTFGAMTIYLDIVVKNLTIALKDKGMWDNAILIYASDNGGDPTSTGNGNNMPLRGRKSNFFEGGIRIPAFIHSPLLPDSVKHSKYDYMFHITDWLPTIVHGILGRDDLLKDMSVVQDSMDGVNHWKQLLEGSDSSSEKSYPSKAPRREILIGIDYLNAQDEWVGYDTAAVIVGYDKLVTNEVNETWWDTPGTADTTREPLELNTETPVYTFLFNLRNDPEEKVDLSEVYPEKVEQLKSVLASYRKTMVNNLFCADTTSNYLDADSIQEVDGFIRPWATNTAICPERICFDGVSEKDYYPSYLNGEYPI